MSLLLLYQQFIYDASFDLDKNLQNFMEFVYVFLMNIFLIKIRVK